MNKLLTIFLALGATFLFSGCSHLFDLNAKKEFSRNPSSRPGINLIYKFETAGKKQSHEIKSDYTLITETSSLLKIGQLNKTFSADIKKTGSLPKTKVLITAESNLPERPSLAYLSQSSETGYSFFALGYIVLPTSNTRIFSISSGENVIRFKITGLVRTFSNSASGGAFGVVSDVNEESSALRIDILDGDDVKYSRFLGKNLYSGEKGNMVTEEKMREIIEAIENSNISDSELKQTYLSEFF